MNENKYELHSTKKKNYKDSGIYRLASSWIFDYVYNLYGYVPAV